MNEPELLIEVENHEPYKPRTRTKQPASDTVKRVIGPDSINPNADVPVQPEN